MAGPTCDSLDICTRDQALPQDLVEDDFIYIKNAGAYTTAYASTFNGFPLPDVIIPYRHLIHGVPSPPASLCAAGATVVLSDCQARAIRT